MQTKPDPLKADVGRDIAVTEIAGKTAFVTGGASGIGLGIAKKLLERGANVVIADIRQDHLDDAVAEMDGGDRVMAQKLDVTDRDAYAKAADAVEARFGKLHILVNNAGVAAVGPVELASYGDWDWQMNVNVGGVINGMVTWLPRILAHGEGGHIVSTASMAGLMPHPGAVIYGATKSAIVGMSECMREELEPKGVIVAAFCPGAVQSQIHESQMTRPDAHADTGYGEADKGRQSMGAQEVQSLFKTKEVVGDIVCDGIEGDDLYIMTHHEYGDGLRDRAAAMVAAIPDHLPSTPGFEEAFGRILSNPAHAKERDRQLARHKDKNRG